MKYCEDKRCASNTLFENQRRECFTCKKTICRAHAYTTIGEMLKKQKQPEYKRAFFCNECGDNAVCM